MRRLTIILLALVAALTASGPRVGASSQPTVRCGELEGHVCYWLLHPDEAAQIRSDLDWDHAWTARAVNLGPGCYSIEGLIIDPRERDDPNYPEFQPFEQVTYWVFFEDGTWDELWTMPDIPDDVDSIRQAFPLATKIFDKRVTWIVATHPRWGVSGAEYGNSVYGIAISFRVE